MFGWLRRWLDRDFRRTRPPGLRFPDNAGFFWYEVSLNPSQKIKPNRPILALVVAAHGEAAFIALGLGRPPQGTQHFDVRLATGGGQDLAGAYSIGAEPPLAVGDIAIFLPVQKHPALSRWQGPLIAELAPEYSQEGYVVQRTFV